MQRTESPRLLRPRTGEFIYFSASREVFGTKHRSASLANASSTDCKDRPPTDDHRQKSDVSSGGGLFLSRYHKAAAAPGRARGSVNLAAIRIPSSIIGFS